MVTGLTDDLRFDYSGIERAVNEAGLILSPQFSRSDGICNPDIGEPRTSPSFNNIDPTMSRTYRHIVGDNTSYGYVDTSGKVTLSVRLGFNSSADATKIVPEIIGKYNSLRIKLDRARIGYVSHLELDRALFPLDS